MLTHPAILWLINIDLDAVRGFGNGTKMRKRNQSITLTESQLHAIDPTNSGVAFDDSIEHRLYVRVRASDDAEDLSSSSLMLQGLPQFRVAFLKFLEQSHVLDGDDRLISESFQ